MGFGVFGFGVQGLGFGVQGSGFRVWGFRVQGRVGFGVQGLGFAVIWRRCCEREDAAGAREPRQVLRAALVRLWKAIQHFSPTPGRPRWQSHSNLVLFRV